LREGLAACLPAAAAKAERRLGALARQGGQPIAIGPAGALRIRIGAHLVAARQSRADRPLLRRSVRVDGVTDQRSTSGLRR